MQPAETGGDVERDVLAPVAAGEPRPRAVLVLSVGQLLHHSGCFLVETVVVEENADIPPRLAFGLGRADPRRLFEHNRLEILVLLQRTVESGGSAPLLENAMNLGIAGGNMPRQALAYGRLNVCSWHSYGHSVE